MNQSLKRLTVAFTFSLYNKSSHFLSLIFPYLKLALSKTLRFLSNASSSMEPFLFYHDYSHNDDVFGPDLSPSILSTPSIDSLFLVSFRWWNEAREGMCGGGGAEVVVDGVLYDASTSIVKKDDVWENEEMETEILLELRREGETEKSEEGVSGGGGGEGGGAELALISEWMFLRAMKWHDDIKDVEFFSAGQDNTQDLFSLQIRLSCMWRTNSVIIRISQKDNEVRAFHKAFSIFGVESHLMQVWDFSGQMNKFVMNGQKLLNDSSQLDEEMFLELQVYGLSNCLEKRNGEMRLLESKVEDASCSSSLKINGNAENSISYFRLNQPPSTSSSDQDACTLGLTGLSNLGNTCFMNSALQCLAHTVKLVDYFLGDFRKDLNVDNPLGMNGKLATAFGDLLRKLWFPGASTVAPRMFKSAIAGFAPQFSGYNQHDSQEFLAFLLDGLHEDLNRVKCKPYVESKDGDGRPDEEVADEHWRNHLARNSSIIVDLCQGQYRSTLVCPVCQKKSLTFDPFMYLSLPLPSTTTRTITVTVLSSDGTTLPSPVSVTVPNNGSSKDLVQALITACALGDDETLLIAEVYNNRIIRYLDNPSGSLDLIRDDDQLVAYKLPKDHDKSARVVFSHLHEKPLFMHSSGKKFAIPLVTSMSNISKGSEIREMFLKLLTPFLMPEEEFSVDDDDALQNTSKEDTEMGDVNLDRNANFKDEKENTSSADSDFNFYLDTDNYLSKNYKIQMDEPVPIPKGDKPIEVHVHWTEKMIENYDTALLKFLPEVCKPTPRRVLESVSLDKCLDAFLKEEPLGPDDMWYCPNCKTHQQASKKLDLWRLPEILVIHLKRFSYNRYFKNKLETFVDFPIDEFDLTNYKIHKDNKVMDRYTLFAISNHYGGMGGGHYTAFAQHKHNHWYEFDDAQVFPVREEQIKTPAAYLLFYRRISDI